MRIIIDTEAQTISQENAAGSHSQNLYSRAAFEMLSQLWLKVGWNQKYTYTFSWFGRPIIQLPDDMVRLQEVIYRLKPDVILETGIAHGGSLIYSASLCKAMGKGRVIGVDIEIRPHNRQAIEAHELFPLITLVEGNSIDPQVVQQVKSLISADETVLLILDSCHTRDHVKGELEAFHDVVSPGFYIVVADGFMKELADVPRGNPDWIWDNPLTAAQEFLENHSEFVLESKPSWPFNESDLTKNVTHCPLAWLLRKSDGPF
jgi:cephalosporin hydroxylase